MTIRDYFQKLQASLVASPLVLSVDLRLREIDLYEGYIRGCLLLGGGTMLHVAEYVITTPRVRRIKYRYHLQRPNGRLLSRWDNAAHFAHLPTAPYHRHASDGAVEPSPPMDILAVLAASVPLLDRDLV